MTPNSSDEAETRQLIALVMPPKDNSTEPFKVYVVWKIVQSEPDEEFKIVSTMNVMIPGMKRYYDMTEILALHGKIQVQLKTKTNVILEFLFHNV